MKRFLKFILRPNQRNELYFALCMHLVHGLIFYDSIIKRNFLSTLKDQSGFWETLFWSFVPITLLVPVYYWISRYINYKDLVKKGLA